MSTLVDLRIQAYIVDLILYGSYPARNDKSRKAQTVMHRCIDADTQASKVSLWVLGCWIFLVPEVCSSQIVAVLDQKKHEIEN